MDPDPGSPSTSALPDVDAASVSRQVEDDEDVGGFGEMFPEEERPPTPPSTSEPYLLPSSHPLFSSTPHDTPSLIIHLVSENPLWGHLLWNASRSISEYLSDHAGSLVEGKHVVEFGAGGGLPGLVCAGLGARRVVITDYPEEALLQNIRRNVRENGESGLLGDRWEARVDVKGFVWGKRADDLLSLDSGQGGPASEAGSGSRSSGFDLLILSDLIFNHSQHVALLESMAAMIRPNAPNSSLQPEESSSDPKEPEDKSSLPKTYVPEPSPRRTGSGGDRIDLLPHPNQPRALIFFSHHLPHHKHRDLLFFHRAAQRGWAFRRVGKWKVGVMFEEDDKKLARMVEGEKGGRDVREVVEGWEMWRP